MQLMLSFLFSTFFILTNPWKKTTLLPVTNLTSFSSALLALLGVSWRAIFVVIRLPALGARRLVSFLSHSDAGALPRLLKHACKNRCRDQSVMPRASVKMLKHRLDPNPSDYCCYAEMKIKMKQRHLSLAYWKSVNDLSHVSGVWAGARTQ